MCILYISVHLFRFVKTLIKCFFFFFQDLAERSDKYFFVSIIVTCCILIIYLWYIYICIEQHFKYWLKKLQCTIRFLQFYFFITSVNYCYCKLMNIGNSRCWFNCGNFTIKVEFFIILTLSFNVIIFFT